MGRAIRSWHLTADPAGHSQRCSDLGKQRGGTEGGRHGVREMAYRGPPRLDRWGQIMTCTLDYLADEPVWVAWRNERRGDKLRKVPYAPSGDRAEVDNPDTWGTWGDATKRAKRI